MLKHALLMVLQNRCAFFVSGMLIIYTGSHATENVPADRSSEHYHESIEHDQSKGFADGLEAEDDGTDLFDELLLDESFTAAMDAAKISRSSTCTPQFILNQLLTLKVPDLLKKNFYRYTYPVETRNILDDPAVQPWFNRAKCATVSVLPFYNQTTAMFFTRNSSLIDSYLAFGDADFIDIIDQAVLIDIDIPEVIELFKPIKLQERRFGLMLGAGMPVSRFYLSAYTPLYYQERNFFLTKAEIDRIQRSPFFVDSTGSDEEEARAFLIKHLLSDRVGLGDMRLSCLYNMYNSCSIDLWGGVEFTVPTAVTFHNGILGGTYSKSQAPVTNFNFKRLFELGLCSDQDDMTSKNEAIEMGKDFAIGALDRLTSNLCDRSLGNGGHFGIAPAVDLTWHMCSWARFYTKAAIEYLCPKTEDRFYIISKTDSEFDRDYTDPELANANLAFLNQQAINMLYPYVISTKVQPGLLVKYRAEMQLDFCWVRLVGGYDFWSQQQEKISIACPFQQKVDLCRGIKPAAYQHKLYGMVDFQFPCGQMDLRLGLRGAGTVASRGIGKDFTAAVDITWSF